MKTPNTDLIFISLRESFEEMMGKMYPDYPVQRQDNIFALGYVDLRVAHLWNMYMGGAVHAIDLVREMLEEQQEE